MAEFAPVAEADLPVIKEIYDYYILNSTATFHSIPITIMGLREILFIDNPKYPSFTIRKDGRIIGYCFLARYKNRQAYDRTAELSIYLRPECTGKGIGPAALSCLETAAQRSGIHILIGTLCGENCASIRLMEKAGYTKAAHLRNVGEKFGNVLDVVIYQKEI
ncbi:MAG TPA: N-acetyltransferase family protein [Methanoregulaceae archaeon]|nr:N-acetyltransferase family protein [Methanoregulaceae archaeon]HPD75773.1 N-acetyltransferase family protein [Methanoregulaceae archaeon]HRY75319.1 N-acetyltransferase family protein [Methanoregulaceae archaeon]